MLKVKTKIGQSNLHGMGLFADQDIPKGTVVWEYNLLVDRTYSEEELKMLPDVAARQIKHYGYLNDYGDYVLCGDDARFFNHSLNANCFEVYSPGGTAPTFADRDIDSGEELTINYCQFDNSWKDKHIVLSKKEKRELLEKGLLLDTKRRIFPRMVKRI